MTWSRSGPVRSKPMMRATPTVSSELDAATAACKTATIARRYSTGAILSGRRNEAAAPRRQRGFFKLETNHIRSVSEMLEKAKSLASNPHHRIFDIGFAGKVTRSGHCCQNFVDRKTNLLNWHSTR